MNQPFDCFCGTETCRGRISGAKHMTKSQLEGVWLNGHIRELLEQQKLGNDERGLGMSAAARVMKSAPGNGHSASVAANAKPIEPEDPTARALRDALSQAEKVVEAARAALRIYTESARGAALPNSSRIPRSEQAGGSPAHKNGSFVHTSSIARGSDRRGPTSRELSGEMGGDTSA
jgi:hypothetical protein